MLGQGGAPVLYCDCCVGLWSIVAVSFILAIVSYCSLCHLCKPQQLGVSDGEARSLSSTQLHWATCSMLRIPKPAICCTVSKFQANFDSTVQFKYQGYRTQECTTSNVARLQPFSKDSHWPLTSPARCIRVWSAAVSGVSRLDVSSSERSVHHMLEVGLSKSTRKVYRFIGTARTGPSPLPGHYPCPPP